MEGHGPEAGGRGEEKHYEQASVIAKLQEDLGRHSDFHAQLTALARDLVAAQASFSEASGLQTAVAELRSESRLQAAQLRALEGRGGAELARDVEQLRAAVERQGGEIRALQDQTARDVPNLSFSIQELSASLEATHAGFRSEVRQDLERLRGELEVVQRRQMHQDSAVTAPDLSRRLQELTASVEATRGLFRVEVQQEVQRMRKEIEQELEKEASKWAAHADEVQQVISEMVQRLVELGGRLPGRAAGPQDRGRKERPAAPRGPGPRDPRDWHSVATPPASCRGEAPEPEPAPRTSSRVSSAEPPGRPSGTLGMGSLHARMDAIEAEYISLYRQLQRVERSAREESQPRADAEQPAAPAAETEESQPRADAEQPAAPAAETEAAPQAASWGSCAGEQAPGSLCSEASRSSSAVAAPRSERSYRLVGGRAAGEASAEAGRGQRESAGDREKAEGSEHGAGSATASTATATPPNVAGAGGPQLVREWQVEPLQPLAWCRIAERSSGSRGPLASDAGSGERLTHSGASSAASGGGWGWQAPLQQPCAEQRVPLSARSPDEGPRRGRSRLSKPVLVRSASFGSLGSVQCQAAKPPSASPLRTSPRQSPPPRGQQAEAEPLAAPRPSLVALRAGVQRPFGGVGQLQSQNSCSSCSSGLVGAASTVHPAAATAATTYPVVLRSLSLTAPGHALQRSSSAGAVLRAPAACGCGPPARAAPAETARLLRVALPVDPGR